MTETTTTTAIWDGSANSTNNKSNANLIHYESKRRNVSRLLTTLIAPSDSPATTLLLGPHSVHVNTSNTIRASEGRVGGNAATKNYTHDKRPNIVVFPTGE